MIHFPTKEERLSWYASLLGRVRVTYYDGAVVYMTKQEYADDCKRLRQLSAKLKEQTPFSRYTGGEYGSGTSI